MQAALAVSCKIFPPAPDRAQRVLIHCKSALLAFALDPGHETFTAAEWFPPAIFLEAAVSILCGDLPGRVGAELKAVAVAGEVGFGDPLRAAPAVRGTPIRPRGLNG